MSCGRPGHVKERLDDLRLASFVRTTGGKGVHVVVPIDRRTSWEELKGFARAFADALVRQEPKRYIATASKTKRTGKIYLDYLRNEQAQPPSDPIQRGPGPAPPSPGL